VKKQKVNIKRIEEAEENNKQVNKNKIPNYIA
jgi:hypothetical protein